MAVINIEDNLGRVMADNITDADAFVQSCIKIFVMALPR